MSIRNLRCTYSATRWLDAQTVCARRATLLSLSVPVSFHESVLVLTSKRYRAQMCEVENSVLSPRNPSFFIAHPPHLVGPHQLYLKAIVLLGKVVQFSHRAPFAAKFAQSRLDDGVPDIRKT